MKLMAIKEMIPAGRDTADVTITVRSTADLAELSEAANGLKKRQGMGGRVQAGAAETFSFRQRLCLGAH